jgi:arsenite/tail-anchored protein-transporting ATPase
MGVAAPDWLTSTRVAVVAGKGGVGSSTVAAAYALAAAREGADVLFVAVDGRPGMGPLLGGRELDSSDRILRRIKGAGQVRGRTIPADQAFGDYLELKGVGGMLRRAASAASLPMIAAATPGLEHLLVLGKIKELERERRGRPDRRRRTTGRACGAVPALGDGSVRRRPVGPGARAGGRGRCDAARSGAVSVR